MRNNFRLLIGSLIVTIILFIVFNVNQLQQEVEENQYNRLIADMSNVASDFSIWISDKKMMLETAKDVVDNFSYDQLTSTSTDNPFLKINETNPDIPELYVGLSDGRFLSGNDWLAPEDYDPRNRIWYQEAIEADATIVSSVYTDIDTGNQTVTISSPLYLDGEFVGVIAADVYMNNIEDYLREQIVDSDIYTYIVDKYSTILLHTRREYLIGQNLYTDIKNQDIIHYHELARETGTMIPMNYVYEGRNTKGIVQGINDGEWFLTVAMVDDRSLLNQERFGLMTIFLNLFLIFFIMGFIYLIQRMNTRVHRLNKSLLKDNERDFLTGIYNRRYFNLYMEDIWKESDGIKEVSLMMIDIDHFKRFNDTYGHLEGDTVLKTVTAAMNAHLRQEDILARYGGEEFALVLNGVSQKDAANIAETLRQAIYDLDIAHEPSANKRVTISIGLVSIVPTKGLTINDTILRADEALYKAKEEGRNRVVSG